MSKDTCGALWGLLRMHTVLLQVAVISLNCEKATRLAFYVFVCVLKKSKKLKKFCMCGYMNTLKPHTLKKYLNPGSTEVYFCSTLVLFEILMEKQVTPF